MTALRLIGDEILLDGVTVGTLVPGLRLSQRDRLEEAFDALDEDEAGLDEEIERLIRAMAEAGRPQTLAARMRRARMRLVAQKPDGAINPEEPRP